jgi:hypothetical protein
MDDLGFIPDKEDIGFIPDTSTATIQETPEQMGFRADEEFDLANEHNLTLNESQKLISGPEPSAFRKHLTKIQEYITEKTGLLQPDIGYISNRKNRIDKPIQTLAQVGVYQGANMVSGLSATSLDVLANKTTGDKTLADLVARLTGFEPDDTDVQAGEAGKYVSVFVPAGAGVNLAVKGIPAAAALKTILSAGLTFATTEAAVQFSKNITEGKPVDWNEIHYQSGVGVLFGIGEVSVAAAVSGLAKAMDRYWGAKGIELADKIRPPGTSLQEQVARQNAEIRADIKRAKQVFRETGKMPDDLMDKYVRGVPQKGSVIVQEKPITGKAEGAKTTIKTSGKPTAGAVETAPVLKEKNIQVLYPDEFSKIEKASSEYGTSPEGSYGIELGRYRDWLKNIKSILEKEGEKLGYQITSEQAGTGSEYLNFFKEGENFDVDLQFRLSDHKGKAENGTNIGIDNWQKDVSDFVGTLKMESDRISPAPAVQGEVKPTDGGKIPIGSKQGGFVDLSGPTEAVKEIVENGITYVKEMTETTKELVDALKFYPNTPMEFRNAVRTEIIGANGIAGHKIYQQLSPAILGGLSRDDIEHAAQIFYAKDELVRTKAGKGNPDLTVEGAQNQLDELMADATPEILKAVEDLSKVQKDYTEVLAKRGLIDPDTTMEDYARHYVIDYTPDWAFRRGLPPAKLRTPFRGYMKTATGTKKEYYRTMESILFSFYEKEMDNIVADFIEKQTAKYNLLPKLSDKEKIKIFGVDENGKIRKPKPGRIFDIDGKRYRAFSPDMPFARTFYVTENGELAMGGYKHVSLIPEDIYDSFNKFTQRGGPIIARVNQAARYWKSMAILSHYTGFNINNIIGDTYAAMIQHPRPDRLIAEYTTALRYVSGKGKGQFYDDLDKFIRENDIVKGMLTTTELASFRNSKNPIAYVLQKMQDFSEYRESINRVAYSASLLRESQAGKGKELIKYHNWIDTTGLDEQAALGKISRDVEVDYKWVSKSWARYVSGGVAPFGTWYFKMSANVWKWALKHWGKALVAFLAAPIISTIYNDRNEETREMEKSLPDSARNRTHFILGKNSDGSIRYVALQLPQDALIGTKIFSIATSYANRVALGEMTATEAAVKTLKNWGYKETAGTASLMSPLIRFFAGLSAPGRKDPYDGSPVYSKDPSGLPKGRYWKETMLYGIKCMTPFLSANIATYERGLPQDMAWKQAVDTLAGKRAFGIYDINPKTERIITLESGKTITLSWDTNAKMTWVARHIDIILDDFEDAFAKSGLQPGEFYKTKEAKEPLLRIHQLWNKFEPNLNKGLDDTKKAEFVIQRLGERALNRIFSAGTLSKWYQVRLSRAKTDEEKTKLGQEYQRLLEYKVEEAIKGQPKSAREAIMSIEGKELPIELLWELP